MQSPTSEYYCPEGTIYDPENKTCNYSLADIATAQQAIAKSNNKGILSQMGGESSPPPLTQGKYSFDSNPVTPPWVQMPDGGFPFTANGNISTPAIGAGFTDIIGATGTQVNGSVYYFQVPNGNDGVIKKIVLYYSGGGFQQGSGQLIFRLVINGQAVRNYDNILVTLGSGIFPGEVEGIRINSGDTVELQVSNISLIAGGTFISGILVGYFYPNKLSQ